MRNILPLSDSWRDRSFRTLQIQCFDNTLTKSRVPLVRGPIIMR